MKNKPITLLVFASVSIALLLSTTETSAKPATQADVSQEAAVQEAQPAKQEKLESKKPDEKTELDEPILDTAKVSSRRPQFPEKYVRFHMWDGSIIGGEVQTDSITVKTDFGSLVVPINRILKIHPGLQSLPALNKQLATLVEGLGDRDFDVREKSQRTLTGMGIQIRSALQTFDNGGSAERKKRLNEVKAAIDEILDELNENEEDVERALVPGDTVVTPEFSIVGEVNHDMFRIKSKFGELQVQLADIRVADRDFKGPSSELRKTVSVGAMVFFQKDPVSTRVRVNVGDRVRIDSSGVVQWTNWNVTSTPDGIANQGSYQSFQGGTLCARIGNGGNIQKVGGECDFVAKKSGVLYLAIAMQDNYVNSGSYRWTGEYKARIRVTPAVK